MTARPSVAALLETTVGLITDVPATHAPFTIEIPAGMIDAIAKRTAEIILQTGIVALTTPWMTRKQAAEYLGLPVSRLEKDRTIPCHRDNGRVLYQRDELDAHFLSFGR
jgi:hypothetical protein